MKERKPNILNRREFLKISGTFIAGMAFPEILYQGVPYISHGDRNSNKVALTIDDGWNSDIVESAMEILEDDPASFFIVGNRIANKPEIYKEAIKSGFEIHNHTWSHNYLNDPDTNISYEILNWEHTYNSLDMGKYKNKVLRPPANEGVNDPILYSILEKYGYKAVIGWSYGSPGVYRNYTKDDVVDFILPKLEGGDIVLMHFTQTDIDALPEIIREVKHRRLELVGLSKMPGIPIYIKEKENSNEIHKQS
jgi:peptidoglycan/xylan/chitin deacetylase (PgdA/CDA1 family)